MTPTATATAVSFCRWGHLSKITDLPGVSLAPRKAPALTLSLERRSQLMKQTDRDRCTWYIASDLLASIYLEDVALRKHWKWTRVNSMLIAPGYVAAGIDQDVHLPNTLKPPRRSGRCAVHLDKGSPSIIVNSRIHINFAISNIHWLLKYFEGLWWRRKYEGTPFT